MDFQKIALDIMEKICETDEVREDLDLDLEEAGFIDSLSTINIILSVEEILGVRLQPTDFEKKDIKTVNNLSAFLERKCSKAG